MDMIAEHVGTSETGLQFFTTLDMTYVYGQVDLSADTARHFSFQMLGGKATGVYRFVTGRYGLATMPTVFQTIMDLTLAGIEHVCIPRRYSSTNSCIEVDHIGKVTGVLRRLDETISI